MMWMDRAGCRNQSTGGGSLLLGVTILAVSGCGPGPSDDAGQLAERVVEGRRLEAAAREAAGKGDDAEYLRLIRDAVELRPQHPYLLYRLADAHVLSGDTAAALAALARVAEMGIAASPGDEPDFAPLTEHEGFRRLLRHFESNGRLSGDAELAFRIEEEAFLPEGLAHDARDGAFFVASVHRRVIARVAGGATPRLFPVDDVLSPMGMVLDSARGVLWVAASAVAEGEGTDSTRLGTAAVLALDPVSGARLGTWAAPEDGKRHLFGDLALGPDGSVIVSDSWAPGLYRLERPEDELRPLPLSEPLLSPQGITVADDGGTVFLADYALGVLRIDVANGVVAALDYPADRTLLGVDGLYRVGPRALVGIQNGIAPARVVRIGLAPDGRAVDTVETLSAAHSLHDDPALGVVVADTLFYVANGQWAKFSPDAADGSAVDPPAVLKLTLRRRPGSGTPYGAGDSP